MRKNPTIDANFDSKEEQIEALKFTVDMLYDFLIGIAVDKEFDAARDRLFVKLGLASEGGEQ